VQQLQQRTEAHILIFNTPVIVPGGKRTYNAKMMPGQSPTRQRAFTLALLELAQELNFSVIDLDRIIKKEGVHGQVDFAHWPADKWKPVAQETFETLQDLGVFSMPAQSASLRLTRGG